ncbi:MAG: thiamine pyrophosphate-dependent dehydrogenase E1 component subunit alpha [Gemmatimonadales bacterium]|nr:thiamine pyrophosphate-dependent dehydrogenase E1 component subunit alpha [Gemmatimonadales bacterium]
MTATSEPRAVAAPPHGLTHGQLLELYHWMRLTRTLEERLVALYRQTKVVGGLFRSLGQEACAVGSAFALQPGDILSPLIRNLGSMLVKGALPVEILRQYMAKGDSMTRGRELNIHIGDLDRGFIGQISHLGDMIPVMAGVALSFKMRKQPRVARQFVDKAIGYGVHGLRGDGNDVLEVYRITREAVDRARRGEGVTLVEFLTYRRKGHAEHDNQSYVPEGEIERWAATNDPVDRYVSALTGTYGVAPRELEAIDARVRDEVDQATDVAERSLPPEPMDALVGVYADPPQAPVQWYREGQRSAVERNERAQGWGTFNG